MASAGGGSGIPVTVDDRWHVGSVTKSMTATLLAVLEDDGLLSADDTVAALLPEFEVSDGWEACTLDHLLTHTAGAPANFPRSVQSVWPETPGELVAARRRFIAPVLAREPESPCGERFAYSNVGYTIAGHIAETMAGDAYESLLRERVFAPLGLASAGFGPPQGDAPDQEPIGHQVALGIRLGMDPVEERADNSPVMAPAGAAHMTILDLARYGAAHLEGESVPSPALLPPAAWERLHTPVLDDYARGWVRYERDWAGGPVLWHNGSNRLWYALLCCPRRTRCWRSRRTRARCGRQRPRSSSWQGSSAGPRRDPDPANACSSDWVVVAGDVQLRPGDRRTHTWAAAQRDLPGRGGSRLADSRSRFSRFEHAFLRGHGRGRRARERPGRSC